MGSPGRDEDPTRSTRTALRRRDARTTGHSSDPPRADRRAEEKSEMMSVRTMRTVTRDAMMTGLVKLDEGRNRASPCRGCAGRSIRNEPRSGYPERVTIPTNMG